MQFGEILHFVQDGSYAPAYDFGTYTSPSMEAR